MTVTTIDSDRPPAPAAARVRRPGLYGRVFAVNPAVLAVAVLLLAFSPATVSAPILPRQLLLLLAGLVVMLVANAILLRLSLQPWGGSDR